MVMYRVLKDYVFIDSRGRKIPKCANDLINIVQRNLERELLAKGIIATPDSYLPHALTNALPQFSATMRVGIWLSTTKFYSGGRVHLYQYACAMKKLGAEVFLITNSNPIWAGDYPAELRPKIITKGEHAPPRDLDLIITDSKGTFGMDALNYKRTHKRIPFVCFNFETPNWVKEFCPEYGARLEQHKDIFQCADLLIANSTESAKYLREWIDRDIPIHVIEPCVNNYAIKEDVALPEDVDPERPFGIWSARSADYKNSKLAIDTVLSLPAPFDLVMIGQPPRDFPHANPAEHRFIPLRGIPDRQKFALMRAATITLAPSLFEGFGMVPAESLCCGTPVVAFDLPVLRQNYGDLINYAKWGAESDFKALCAKVIKSKGKLPKTKKIAAERVYTHTAMIKKVGVAPYHPAPKKQKRVSVQLLAYWGFVPESIESVYKHVDEILIAFGRCPAAMEVDDGSLSQLERWIALNDTEDKCKMEYRDLWEGGKLEMRTWCCDNATGTHMLMLDGDEIWVGLDKWLAADIDFGCPRWVNFWHNEKYWIQDNAKLAGTRWGKCLRPFGSVCPHYRWSVWRKSFYFEKHPLPVDSERRVLYDRNPAPAERVPECVIYHLGHALPPSVMRAKHEFYLERDGRDAGRIKRRDAWVNWNGEEGDCGDGIVKKIDWKLPAIVKRACKRGHYDKY